VLRSAKDVVPGVFTVLLGTQPVSAAGKTAKDTAVDGAKTLPALRDQCLGHERVAAGDGMGSSLLA
jgi:hypothetical protein